MTTYINTYSPISKLACLVSLILTFACSAAGSFSWTGIWLIVFLISCVAAFFASIGKSFERDDIEKISGKVEWGYLRQDLIDAGYSLDQLARYEENTGKIIPPGSNFSGKPIKAKIVEVSIVFKDSSNDTETPPTKES